MSQTLALVFTGQETERTLPVPQVEFTQSGIVTENGLIARRVMSAGKWGYNLLRHPMSLAQPTNFDPELYESVSVRRLMPSGSELTEALSKFET